MENAGRALALITNTLYPTGTIVGVVGPGHNGGDTIVALRALHTWGRDVAYVRASPRPVDAELLHGFEIGEIEESHVASALATAAVVLDGVLGTGSQGEPRGRAAELIAAINAAGRPVVAVDIPSGSVEAAVTVSFGFPKFETLLAESAAFEAFKSASREQARWARNNLRAHRVPGYISVHIALKPQGVPPGDATADQMRAAADIAERYGFDDIRVAHEQDLVLPHVKLDDIPAVYAALKAAGLHASNAGLGSDIIACPGLDYCNLSNARSISVANEIQAVFADPEFEDDVGTLHVNVSGCINACGHHHVGHIGILGVDKKGEEFYQVLFGGRADEKATLATIQGPGLRHEEVAPAIRRVIDRYLTLRRDQGEKFIDTMGRVGQAPFKEALYAAA